MRKPLIAAALGWGLDAFDFYLYVYALPLILTAFHIGNAAGGLLATYTLAASAIGGVVMGMVADRIGRARTLAISIAWYATFTCLCGFAQSYAQLAVLRAFEGFGFGGEWAVGSVLIAEWSADRTRGRNLGFVQSSWALGWLAANIAAQIVLATIAPQTAWRVLFFIGVLPAIAVFYVRRNVNDAPLFQAQRRFAFHELFSRTLRLRTLLASLLAAGAQSGYYAIFTWLPTYLHAQRHLPAVSTGNFLYFVIAGAFAGYISAGYINDAIGRRKTFGIFAVCSAIVVPVYLHWVSADWQLYIAGPLLGYFASGIFSGFGAFLSELFPGSVRGTAQGFCYNAGRGVAGFAPALIGWLSARANIGEAMTIVAVCAYGLVVLSAFALPETRAAALSPEPASA
ncbi:MAG TPA: MFS transporter [Candidatus Baltobacteraceae bacterium]|nr:MFS transporter [Candidatus Baltobacteraceae bacterium]